MKRHRPTEPNNIKLLRGQKGGEHAAEEKVCHSVPLVLQLHRSRRGPGQLTGISTQTNWKKGKKKKPCDRNQAETTTHSCTRVPTHVPTYAAMCHPSTQPPIHRLTRPFIHPSNHQSDSPAVATTGADHKLVIAGESNIGHVSRVTKVPLVFGLWKHEKVRRLSLPVSLKICCQAHIQISRRRGSQRA